MVSLHDSKCCSLSDGGMVFEYTALCVPTHYNTNPSYTSCTLVIATDTENNMAHVVMTNLDTSWEFEVTPGIPVTMSMDQAYQLTSGVEEKRLKIVSDQELFVTTTKEDSQYGDRYIETTVWPEKNSVGRDFFILQDESVGNLCTSSSYRNVFYAFVSFEAAAFVDVYNTDEELEATEVLGVYSTYSRFTTSANTDWTGLRVSATKPIAVISGTLCVTDASTGTYLTTLPPVTDFGREFIVPSIVGSPVAARYAVRILAAEDQTIVSKDGINHPLNRGENMYFDFDTIISTGIITCSKECLAVFFQRSTSNNIGHFMTQLICLISLMGLIY